MMIKHHIQKIIDHYKFWHIGVSEWRRVIYALIYREAKTSWGERALGILWALIEPVSHIFILSLLRTALKEEGAGDSGMSMILLLATGIFTFFVFRDTFNTVKASISANRALLVFPQIHILDFVLARGLLKLMTCSISFFIFVVCLNWFDQPIQLVNMMSIMIGFLLMWVLGIGFGLLCLPLHGRFKFIDQIITIALRVLYFVSGVMFSFNDIPLAYHIYLSWIPTFHGIEYVRSGFSYIYGEMANIEYLFYVATLSILFGMMVLRKKRNYILSVR